MPSRKSLLLLACLLACLLITTPVLCQPAQKYDLTGMWRDDVGGQYRIRQAGGTVVWSDDRSPTVLNVFAGTIQGDAITGQWWDVPGSRLLGSGTLSLRIDSNDRLVITGSSIPYGGSVITRIGSGGGPGTGTPGGGGCTPVGTWNWKGGATVVIRSDGSQQALVNGSAAFNGQWQSLGGGLYRLTWRENGAVDTLRLASDGMSMDGSNNFGDSVHVTCQTSRGEGQGAVCTPVGTWSWKGGAVVRIHADGSQEAYTGSTRSFTGRWEPLGDRRYRLTWREHGAVDTLRLSPDGRIMDGSNNYGDSLHVTCQSSSDGAVSSGPASGGGGCADPRTIGFLDEWLARAIPTGQGSYRFDSWARWIGKNETSQVDSVHGLPVDPYTWATRCDYLWSVADKRDSTNLGNMGAWVRGRLAGR